jgi:hypothetical protein
MKQLWRIFLFDIRMSFKNFMGAYLLIIPMVILLILRSFLPAVDSSSANFAVINEGPNAVDRELIATLDEIGDVSFYSTIEELEDRMAAIGEIEGLYWDPRPDSMSLWWRRPVRTTRTVHPGSPLHPPAVFQRKLSPGSPADRLQRGSSPGAFGPYRDISGGNHGRFAVYRFYLNHDRVYDGPGNRRG